MTSNRVIYIATALMAVSLSTVRAQEPPPAIMDHSMMDHGAMSTDDQNGMETADSKRQKGTDNMNSSDAISQARMQGGSPPADARSPDYSEGYGFGEIPRPVFADEHSFASLLVDRFERVRTDDNTSATYDLQAWYGRDYNRAVLKAEGDIDSGSLEDATTELLWGHAIATYWNTQLGLRYDSGDAPDRTWLAFGVQGLAPYWFEVDATAYVGKTGRTAFNLEVEYDLLLTQKLILQPRIEMDLYGKRDAARNLGNGLSDASAGLRLRYEIRREFAPYAGIEFARKFGDTKDFARTSGLNTSETRFVAGLRFWF